MLASGEWSLASVQAGSGPTGTAWYWQPLKVPLMRPGVEVSTPVIRACRTSPTSTVPGSALMPGTVVAMLPGEVALAGLKFDGNTTRLLVSAVIVKRDRKSVV